MSDPCVVVCPGIHPPELTDQFLKDLGLPGNQFLVVPASCPPYSPGHLWQFLQHTVRPLPQDLSFIAFSAGVVGATKTAQYWQNQRGGRIKALITLDGWGVPKIATVPTYAVSHDAFTAWSTNLLGHGPESFYADPPVAHLDLWRSPQRVEGWQEQWVGPGLRVRSPTTVAQFIQQILAKVYSVEGYYLDM